MQVKNKVYCRLDFLRVVTEETLRNPDGTFKTLSITNGKEYEMMIFLGRKNLKSDYSVKVYKCEPRRIFIPHPRDNFRRYDVGPFYDVFFFDDLEVAKDFIRNLFGHHPEYEKRPVIVAKN